MRIAKLRAHNVKGFSDFECECGDVNVCAGDNGTNKTSTLTIVSGLFASLGSGVKGNPRMLRAGADYGELGATLISDDGTESWEITREIKPGKVETPKITSSISGKVGSPVAWLQPLVDRISIEPISRAMNATEEEQVEILLSTIPMAIDSAELATAAAGVDVPGLDAHMKNAKRLASGLDAIAGVHKAIYDHRTNVNRDARLKREHAEQLLESIPKSAEGLAIEWPTEHGRLTREISRLRLEEQAARLDCETILGSAKETIAKRDSKDQREIDDDIDARIRELELERTERKQKLVKEVQEERNRLTIAHQNVLQEISDKYRPQIQELTAKAEVASQNMLDQVQHNRTRGIAAENTRESGILQDKSKDMTAALDRLDKLKADLLGKLDAEIPGLRVENGAISLGGMPLSEKNTAERAKFWLSVCARRAGELGISVMDGAECFSDATFEAVIRAALGSGIQWFFGRVTNEPFSVQRINAADYEVAA